MNLSDLARYERIIIQCHDNPDADSITSGFALQAYIRSLGGDAELVYGGTAFIQKPNLLLLLEALNIKIAHRDELPADTDLLITVDCQHGAGNVTRFALPKGADVMAIDHHRQEIAESEKHKIRPDLASCATLVWDLLHKECFEMSSDLRTALYYGLFSDSNGFSELRHPRDRDLAEISGDGGLIRKLKNSAITTEDLDIISAALRGRKIIDNIGMFRADPCDPNLLGFTADIAQQVVHIDCCVVYCLQPHGVKLSIRSSVREIMASEIAKFLCRDVGDGGGNLEKAGGFISFTGIAAAACGHDPGDYLCGRIRDYLKHYDHVYAGGNNIDFEAMPLYKKLQIPAGYAASTNIFTAGTKITVRTLEGDIDTICADDLYLMIGVEGEVYPIAKKRFDAGYTDAGTAYNAATEYVPVVINRATGERAEITAFARTCMPNDLKLVRAAPLRRETKVFTRWDTERYFRGGAGDWLVADADDANDCYVVRGDIFDRTYALLKRNDM